MYAARPHMLATKILNTRRLPFTAGNLSPTDRDSIYKHHFWTNSNSTIRPYCIQTPTPTNYTNIFSSL